ncbi:MAG: hypothetical protein FJ276_01650, partial [Planctomycetes bacterium]|nr:hypothetical protein [Planctomycetota bacterium]
EFDTARRLRDYFEQMSVAKPFLVRDGQQWESHCRALRDYVLGCAGLHPLPDRVPLDVRMSEPLDHPWCTVQRVSYQLWPGVYSTGLLFMPKQLPDRPAPAVLCPHGHWATGNAHPDVQKRCLNLARMGYVVFSSTQNHYEDLAVGVSHQSLMIWSNMRALDYLESLPEVDETRIGAAGESGGGLQTEMLTALDGRVKAATIVGLTCDFRQIMFPDGSHCTCNHFPNVMRRTDHPEISTLGLPAALQFLTMNDWTRQFEQANFPTIRALYAAHQLDDRVFCQYADTDHNYDQRKRELTYWWMDRWLRGSAAQEPPQEPETVTFPEATITNLAVDRPGDRGFSELSRIFRAQRSAPAPDVSDAERWRAHRAGMIAVLADLLGERTALARQAESLIVEMRSEDELVCERIGYPSEGSLLVPAWVLRPQRVSEKKLPVEILLAAEGKDWLFQQAGEGSPRERARRGALVVLPDLRTFGESFSTGTKDAAAQARAWERNGIVWGRPVPGMAVTDLRAVLDGLACRDDANVNAVSVTTCRSSDLAAAALFAMILDPRIGSADLDFADACYEKRNLMLVSRILPHGDVRRWAELVADRQLQLRNLPAEAGDPRRLKSVFTCLGNPGGLQELPRAPARPEIM